MSAEGQNEGRKRLLLAALIFIGTLALGVIFRQTLRQVVLTPILYLIWAGGVLLKGLGQNCIWMAALLLALVISLSRLRRPRKPAEEPVYAVAGASNGGRIRFWRAQVRASRHQGYAWYYHTTEVRRLVLNALAYREQISAEQALEKVRRGELTVPDEVRSLILLDEDASAERPWRTSPRLWDRVKDLLAGDSEVKEPHPTLVKVADYLESLVEVEDESGNR